MGIVTGSVSAGVRVRDSAWGHAPIQILYLGNVFVVGCLRFAGLLYAGIRDERYVLVLEALLFRVRIGVTVIGSRC